VTKTTEKRTPNRLSVEHIGESRARFWRASPKISRRNATARSRRLREARGSAARSGATKHRPQGECYKINIGNFLLFEKIL